MKSALLALIAVAVVIVVLKVVLSGGERISAAEFVSQRQPSDLVLDVRSPSEFASGHVEGALNLNVMSSDFREQVEALPDDRRVFLYCASGTRSGRAASLVESAGYAEVYNVGSLGAIERAGATIVR